jgi:hypothetical protein
MTRISLDNRTGGIALVVGYGLLIAVLFRNPTDGIATATGTVQGFLFFAVLPVSGLAGGVYTALDWPFRTTVAFVTGSYLAVVGIGLALLPAEDAIVTTVLGVLLLGLAAFALVATVRSAAASLVPGEFFG